MGHEHLAERALNMGEGHRGAVKPHIEALVEHRLFAVFAGPAGPRRRDRDELPFAQMRDAFAERGDIARDLMAQHHRLAQTHGAETAVVVIVQIRAANSARRQPDLDFAGTGSFNGPLLNAKIFCGVNDDRFHVTSHG